MIFTLFSLKLLQFKFNLRKIIQLIALTLYDLMLEQTGKKSKYFYIQLIKPRNIIGQNRKH